MLCVVNGISSVSIGGVEYKAQDNLVEIPNDAYRKIIHHPKIRAATSAEITALEKITADKKAAEEAQHKAAAEADAEKQKAAEEKAKQEVTKGKPEAGADGGSK